MYCDLYGVSCEDSWYHVSRMYHDSGLVDDNLIVPELAITTASSPKKDSWIDVITTDRAHIPHVIQ